MQKVYIFGCGGHARSVTDILLKNNPKTEIVFVDKNGKEGETVLGFKILTDINLNSSDNYFLAIGQNTLRRKADKIIQIGNLINIISPTAHVSKFSNISQGCFIGNFCHIGPEASIGRNTIINNAAIVEHEVKIGEYCHIAPNVAISGKVTIGDHVFVGVGATIINNISVCSDVTIGAGATVVNNITEPGTYIGTPAKKIK